MGKTILTPEQSQVLDHISANKQITQHFYLTGGTALAEFYLHHRLSEDLDFFTQTQEVDPIAVEAYISQLSQVSKLKSVERSQFMGIFSFFINFLSGYQLKIDFSYYPFEQIESGKMHQRLRIDSLRDIAANKIHTLFMQPRDRDYLDLYFILKDSNFSITSLIQDAKAKFDWHIDPLTLSSQFLRSVDITAIHKILVPFDSKAMDQFFIKQADLLKQRVLKTD